MGTKRSLRAPVPAAVALSVGFAALLVVDWCLVAGHGRPGLVVPTVAAAAIVAPVTFLTGPGAGVVIAGIGWTTVAGFSRPPYPDLKSAGTLPAALALVLVAALAAVAGTTAHKIGLARVRTVEAAALLELARTVLSTGDDPDAILGHLGRSLGVAAELVELRDDRWVRVAGDPHPGQTPTLLRPAEPPFALRVFGPIDRIPSGLLEGFAYQASAALHRRRHNDAAAAAETVAAANRARAALLEAVGHTLRTPLTPIKAAVSSLRQTDVAWSVDDQDELLATIEECADRLNAQIANLLDMSRIHAGALHPFLRPAALPELAGQFPDGLTRQAIEVDLPEDIPLVLTDPTLLARALRNLVDNAVRHSASATRPRLTAARSGERVVIRVIDHGGGPAQPRPDLTFEPFAQLDDRHAGAGLGLGLAVARGLVEACGGRLEAAPTPGGGQTMFVDLPCAPADPDRSPQPHSVR
ncbi:MAG TPA: ATP-binding protein [Sporichthyaceae bacterium]|jgi:two-component system sensor histidine kinase KdpD|nr:ATP-binding protein [Sporichthyaceae bacterium]